MKCAALDLLEEFKWAAQKLGCESLDDVRELFLEELIENSLADFAKKLVNDMAENENEKRKFLEDVDRAFAGF